jgi:hypothetical protein
MSLGWALWGFVVAYFVGMQLGGWAERRTNRSRKLLEHMRKANRLDRS